MKKIKITFLLLLCTSLGWAQIGETDFREDWQFGVKMGANYSKVYASSGEEFDPKAKLGFAAGLFLAVPFNKYIGLQPEVLYSVKGFKANGQLQGSSYDITRTTSYLDIPIYISFKPSEFITILVGPQYSYLIRQKDKFDNGPTDAQGQEFESDNTRKSNFGFVGGVDINIGHIVVGPRIGIDALSNNESSISNTPQYKNLWLQCTIGYRFF